MTATAGIGLLHILRLSVAVAAAAARSRQSCVHELVAISPCLSYISSSPNNNSATVPSLCCHALSAIFDSGDASCLCHLLWQPLIFGFPLNTTRLLSLPSLCPQPFLTASSTYLHSLCFAGSPAPPPFSDIQEPVDSGSVSDQPESDLRSTTSSSSSSMLLFGLVFLIDVIAILVLM